MFQIERGTPRSSPIVRSSANKTPALNQEERIRSAGACDS
jgi:hypothetical protein